MSPKLKKFSTYFILIFFSFIIGCISVRKEGKSFIVEIKSKSPAPSTSSPDNISTRQSGALTNTPGHGINEITISWTAPTTNSDGTPLKDLRDYTVYYGQTEKSLGDKRRNRKQVSRNETSTVIYNLASGEWCFEVTAWDTSGNESEFSKWKCINIQ